MNRRQLMASGAVQAIPGMLLTTAAALQSHRSAHAAQAVRIGVLINLSGVGAMYGPVARNCSEIAVSEINARGGIAGRPVEIIFGDAGAEPSVVVKTALKMLSENKVEAFVAMHNSAVRVALVKAFAGRVPYIYTTIYEGGECSRGTYLLGTTPTQQLRPVIPWMHGKIGVRRWYFVGNDYNWPRETNEKARQYIASSGGTVVGEEYVPFDFDDFQSIARRIVESNADIAFVTLVGTSSIRFNQLFGRAGISQSVARLSTYMDELTLAAIGPGASGNLWSSAGYFASLRTAAARDFSSEYSRRFGSPGLITDSAQACYEGFRLLEVMGNKAKALDVESLEKIAQWQITSGPRGQTVVHGRHTVRDIYLAKADGTAFNVVKTFEAVRPDDGCKL